MYLKTFFTFVHLFRLPFHFSSLANAVFLFTGIQNEHQLNQKQREHGTCMTHISKVCTSHGNMIQSQSGNQTNASTNNRLPELQAPWEI